MDSDCASKENMQHSNTNNSEELGRQSIGQLEMQKNEAEQPTSALSLVAATVAGLQATMGGAMQKMAATLNQSVSMMNSMNSCMEEYVKSGLVLRVEIRNRPEGHGEVLPEEKPTAPTTRMSIIASNSSKIPLASITLSLHLYAQDSDDSVQSCISRSPRAESAKDPSCKRRKTDDSTQADGLEWIVTSSHTSTSNEADVCAHAHHADKYTYTAGPFDLQPGEHRRSIMHLELPQKVAPYRGVIRGVFPSPGTKAPLIVESAFKILLVQQCTTTWAPSPLDVSQGESGEAFLAASTLREVFAVPARQGLPFGATGCLNSFEGERVATVQVLDDGLEFGDVADRGTVDGATSKVDIDLVPVRVTVSRGLGVLDAKQTYTMLLEELKSFETRSQP